MKINKRVVVESWLRRHEDIFKKSGLDRYLKLPNGAMQKFYKYDILLNDKRIKKTYKEISKLIESFESLKKTKTQD